MFGVAVPVDGSDGLSHNVTGVSIGALGSETIEVTMAPYALKAASVDVIASPDYIELEGDNIAIGNVAARSIAAGQSFDARSSKTFTAGTLKGFSEIKLEQVDVSGGSLKWLGGAGSAEGATFANLGDMSVGGGEGSFSETISVPYKTQIRAWQAAYDGFLQLQVTAPIKPAIDYLMVEVNVLNSKGDKEFTVTPRGSFGGENQRALWTIPVRKGQFVQLKLDESERDKAAVNVPVHGQFIYFGVPE